MAIYINGRKVDIPGSENGDCNGLTITDEGVEIIDMNGKSHSFPQEEGTTIFSNSNITIHGDVKF